MPGSFWRPEYPNGHQRKPFSASRSCSVGVPLDNLIGLFHGYASLLVLDAAGSDGVGLDALGDSLLGGRGDIGG